MRCGACRADCAPGAKFCSQCGTALTQATASLSGAALDAPQAERRLLHVMFCDLVGSTELSEQLDPEEYRELLRAYYTVCGDAVDRFDGFVAKYMGDGVLIYFGYPVAHDDDARRAALAALEITVAVPALRWLVPEGTGVEPAVRVGIHAGMTVVGEIGDGATHEQLAVGDTPNIAARVQQLAGINEVVVSETTYGLLGGYLRTEPLGEKILKGVSTPVAVHRVLGASGPGRGVRLDRGQFVGRRAELVIITAAIGNAAAGGPALIAVSGEAGIGKSRLVEAVRADVASGDRRWTGVACSPFDRSAAFAPLAQLIGLEAGITAADDDPTREAKVRWLLGRAGVADADGVKLLAATMGLRTVDTTTELTPEVLRRRTTALFRDVMNGLAAWGPLVIVIEDIHWADPSTVEVLVAAADRPAVLPLSIIVTHRPEFASPWTPNSAVLEVAVPGLADHEAVRLVEALVAGGKLQPAVVRDLLDRADGVPFFLEELTQSAHERSTGERGARSESVPMTLQGLLNAQLDRLGPAKRVAQLGAMLGRRFDAEVLRAMRDDPDLADELAALVRADLLRPVTTADHKPLYEFRHALIQEAAYDSMLRSDRRRLHGLIATIYESAGPGHLAARPEVVGQHWQRSGQHRRAAPYLQRAAAHSASVYANAEALELYQQALVSIEAAERNGQGPGHHWSDVLRDVEERRGAILTLLRRRDEADHAYRAALLRARSPVTAARIHCALGSVHEQDRTMALAALSDAIAALGTEPDSDDPEWRRTWIGILLRRMHVHYWSDEPDAMIGIADELRSYVLDVGTPLQRANFHDSVTLLLLRSERYRTSEATLESARRYIEAAEAAGDVTEMAAARFLGAFALLFAGRPEDALLKLETALDLTRRCGYRAIEIRCLAYLATAHRMLDEAALTETYAALAVREASADEMIEYVGLAEGNHAWVALSRGDPEAAARHARDAVAAWDACPMAWPFRWIGVLPQLGAALHLDDMATVVDCARSLVAPHQHDLGDDIMAGLRAVLDAHGRDEIRRAATLAVAAASMLGPMPLPIPLPG